MALASGIAEKAAGAGIHGGGEHEAGGEAEGKRGARDGHASVFERLAHHFEHVALKFRKLVEKEHAIVAQGDFAGARDGAAADQSGVADGVMRRTKWARADEAACVVEQPGNAM